VRHIKSMAWAASLALLIGATGCAGSSPPADGHETAALTRVNVTVLPITNVAPVQLAIDEGFFRKQGLDVRLSFATTGAAIVPGVLNGSVDIGYSNLPALVLARSEGLPIVSIATSDALASSVDQDSNAVIVRSDSGITEAADLNDKTVAVNALGGLIYMITRASADNTGGDSASYEFVEIPFPDMLGALGDGRIVAASITEPFLSSAEASGDYIRVFNTGSLGGKQPGLVFDTYFTSEATLSAKPEVIDAFRAAIYEANKFATQNPDAARAAVGRYTETDPDVLSKMTLPTWPDRAISTANFESVLDLMARYDLLTSDADVPSYDLLIRE